jgi:hypothetical protein
MPSINDIPEHLQHSDKADDFVNWITELPIEATTRVALMRIWEGHVNHRLTMQQYNRVRTEGVR